jgi:8-oxo-dGTP pyrophosphatase MutT (NUDIX family)
VLRRALHGGVSGFQHLRRAIWFFTRPATFGVHAIPVTPDGKLVLVTLSYARGWRWPGGGRKPDEDAETAIPRELREEIGMTHCSGLHRVTDFEHRPDFRRGQSSLFVVHGVVYRPRWSLEIKAVAEFAMEEPPADMAPITRRLLAAAAPLSPST